MVKQTGKFTFKFWGTRGSIPVPGPGTLRYGGNTPCVEIRCGDELIIIDAGTGIRELGTELLSNTPIKATMLFSHTHWDHIQGMPFFRPAYISGNQFKIYGSRDWDEKLESVLKCQMRKPNFPITFQEMSKSGAKMEYIDIGADTVFQIGYGESVTVRSIELHHPDKAFGFRIEYGGKSLVYASDTENLPEPDEKLTEFASGADILIHDAQYTSEEYYGINRIPRTNWGHSTPESAATLAAAANVETLILFHHDPYHNDDKIDQMLQTASVIFPNTVAASERMLVNLISPIVQTSEYLKEANVTHLSRIASACL